MKTFGLQSALLRHFAAFDPDWEVEEDTDWTAYTHEQWPPREIGSRIFLAPHWSTDETPAGRVRIIHNPGMASGTGEHPCTQLALMAIETHLRPGVTVADIGTGSGILGIAALRLGARRAIGVDTDFDSVSTARENAALNGLTLELVAGSATCLQHHAADLIVANINGTVLLSMMDDLLRVSKPGGRLILTGFNESELPFFLRLFPRAEATALNEWRCLKVSMPADVTKQ